MKKLVIAITSLFAIAALIYLGYHAFMASIIENPKTETSNIETRRIFKISAGTSNDIVFTDAQGDHYYINRGLERGLNLDSLNAKVLNKTVTLHLAKILGGFVTSEHIAQLSVDGQIIYTEFK